MLFSYPPGTNPTKQPGYNPNSLNRQGLDYSGPLNNQSPLNNLGGGLPGSKPGMTQPSSYTQPSSMPQQNPSSMTPGMPPNMAGQPPAMSPWVNSPNRSTLLRVLLGNTTGSGR
jgi:hypothetical protein